MTARRMTATLPALAAVTVLATQSPTGREIMERYDRQDRTDDLTAEQEMRLISGGGGERTRALTFATQTDAEGQRKTLIKFTAPGDIAGTGFLAIEHSDRATDKWLYLPALRRTRRIAGSDQTDRFAGTDFTFEDLDAEDLDAHRYILQGSEVVDGVETWLVEAVATDPTRVEETAYGRRELWIGKDHDVIRRIRYYDKEGTLVKEFTADEVRQVPGTDKWRPYRMTMEDFSRGTRTVIEVSEYTIDGGVPDDYFSERYLRRRG